LNSTTPPTRAACAVPKTTTRLIVYYRKCKTIDQLGLIEKSKEDLFVREGMNTLCGVGANERIFRRSIAWEEFLLPPDGHGTRSATDEPAPSAPGG
jgi:hypothetical protein